MRLKHIAILIAKICFLIAAICVIFKQVNISKLGAELDDLNYSFICLALIAANISTILSALRSRLYFADYGLNLTKKFIYKLYFLGCFFNTVLPGGIGGDGYKVYLLSKLKKFDKITALRIALYERANGFYALVFYGLIIFPFTGYAQLYPYLKYIGLACLILITPCYLFGVKYVLKDKISTALHAAKFSFLVQAFQIFSAYLVLKGLMGEFSNQILSAYMLLFVIASIVAIIPISVGGAGLRELTFLYGLEFLPVTNVEVGVAFGILMFIVNTSSSLIGGVIFAFDKIKR